MNKKDMNLEKSPIIVTCYDCGDELSEKDSIEYEIDDVQGVVNFCKVCYDK